MSEEKRLFKKGDQVSWRGKTAKITSDVIHIEGVVCDLRIECDDDEVLTVSHSELLAAQLGINEQDRSASVAFSGDKDGLCRAFVEAANAVEKEMPGSLDDQGIIAGVNKPVGKLDAEGVAEVLKCVGPNDTPGNLNRKEFREELRNDINAAWDFYNGYKTESSKNRRTQLQTDTEKIRKAAQNLSDVLDQSDPVLRKRIFHRIRLNEVREALHGVVQLCQALSNSYSGASSMSGAIGILHYTFSWATACRSYSRGTSSNRQKEPEMQIVNSTVLSFVLQRR